ncbi:MAG: Hpt domain-containing protein [Pirellula sp.]|nr:Hpt domain-containing protein [Pirellula sp.]
MKKFTNPIHSSLAADPDFSDLVVEFVNEIPNKLALIQKSMDQSDTTTLRRTFHQLRGACGGYGFPMLSEAAGLIEDRISSSDPIPELEIRICEFIEMLKCATAEPDPNASASDA